MGVERKITVGWGDADRHFLVWVFHEDWGDADLLHALEICAAHYAESPFRYVLVDYRLNAIPINFIPLIRYALTYWPVGLRRVIVIADGARWRKLYPLFGTLMDCFRSRIQYVDSADAGYAALVALLDGLRDAPRLRPAGSAALQMR